MFLKNNKFNNILRPYINQSELYSPNTALYQNNINQAKAANEAMNDPLANGLNMAAYGLNKIGGMLTSYGVDQQAKELNSQYDSGNITKSAFDNGMQGLNNSSFLSSIFSNIGQSSMGFNIPQFAMGGNPQMMNAELEGGELLENPDGSMQQIQGNSHEDGGVNADIDSLSRVYSDRIKIDGVSIADRVTKRIKRNATLEDLKNRNPYDTIIHKSWERGATINELLKQKEQQLQQEIQQLLNS